MAFNQSELENLLAQTGRQCCICNRLHGIQLHHIISREEGGSDDIDNAIPLCPNCHDVVHSSYASGRVTRQYTPSELKLHRERTIQKTKETINKQPESVQIIAGIHKETRSFQMFVPQTYLRSLPRLKYKAYVNAQSLFKAGRTFDMITGITFITEKLRAILLDLAKTAYSAEMFGGKPISQFFDDMIARLLKASYASQPDQPGSIHRVLAYNDKPGMIDEYIVKIVKDVTDTTYFPVWNAKWELASQYGEDGQLINLDLDTDL